jgi:predicted dehydrogenase
VSTRRSFSLSLLSSAAWAAPWRKIRAAAYGTGHAHASGKVAALRALEPFEFVGVCEPDPEAPRAATAYQGVRWLSEKELLEDPSIELIAVEAGVDRNLEYARRCVDAGKHVHLDKPPGEDLDKLRRMLDEAARRNLRVQMGYQWRYQPGIRAVMEAARQGWLGEIYAVRAVINKPTPKAERRPLARFRGGMMFELGCHLIDRAVDLLGKPKRVTGFLRSDGPYADGLADNTLAILEFDRALAEIYVAAMQPNGNAYRTFEVLGTNGSLAARPFSRSKLYADMQEAAGPYRAGPQVLDAPPDPTPAYAPDFLDLARQIREGALPSWSRQHDLDVQETLLRACHLLA